VAVASLPAATVPAFATDSFAGNTVSLLHFDGNLTDETGKVWTQNGGAATDGTQSKFGGSSLLLDGTNDYIETPTSSDFNLGFSDFAIDFWMKTTQTTVAGLIDNYPAANNQGFYITLGQVTTGKIRFGMGDGSAWDAIESTMAVNDGAWHHIAFVRSGGSLLLFIDGALNKSGTASVGITNLASSLKIGKKVTDGQYYNGYLDELRITK